MSEKWSPFSVLAAILTLSLLCPGLTRAAYVYDGYGSDYSLKAAQDYGGEEEGGNDYFQLPKGKTKSENEPEIRDSTNGEFAVDF